MEASGRGSRRGARSVGGTKCFVSVFFPSVCLSLCLFFFLFWSQVGSFLHSTTSGRWEDVIASALLPPPVGGAENPIWSKSVEWRDGARTGRPAPPPRRTSPGCRVLPGTLIGPVPGGDPGPAPAQPAARRPERACFSAALPLPVPFPNLAPAPARSPGAAPGGPTASAAGCAPSQTSPCARGSPFPRLPRRPLHL